jgi:hypothetical protein
VADRVVRELLTGVALGRERAPAGERAVAVA